MPELFAMPPAPARSITVLLSVLAIVLIPLVLLLGYTAYSGGATRYEVSERGLSIRGTLYGRTIAWEDLDVENARVVNLTEVRELQPTLRTNGIGLPGYQAGWFRTRSGKGLLFVTDRTRVVAVPTRKNYTLLLSVERPEELLAALTRRGS